MTDPAPTHCEECGRPGRVAIDLFPYVIEHTPPRYRWMHQPCANPQAAAKESPARPQESPPAGTQTALF